MKAMSGSIVYVWAARIRGQCCNAPLLSRASIRLSRDDRLIHSLVVHNATFIFNVSTARNVIFLLQEYSFQITLRQQWNDGRLSFKNRIFGMEGKLKAQLKYYVFSSRNFFSFLAKNVTGRDTLHGWSSSTLKPCAREKREVFLSAPIERTRGEMNSVAQDMVNKRRGDLKAYFLSTLIYSWLSQWASMMIVCKLVSDAFQCRFLAAALTFSLNWKLTLKPSSPSLIRPKAGW